MDDGTENDNCYIHARWKNITLRSSQEKKKKSANLQNRCYQYCGQLILTSRVPRLNKKENTRMRLTGIQLAKR